MLDLSLGESELAHFFHRVRIVFSIYRVIQQKFCLALVCIQLYRHLNI